MQLDLPKLPNDRFKNDVDLGTEYILSELERVTIS